MAWESGAQPMVLLTKTDLVDDVAPYLAEVESATLGACPVYAVSARTGEGLDEVRALFGENRTAVLLGSSGVGKSTIVNAFAGNDDIATQEVRESDQRGRHTTTRRELVLLPGGGVILDTPGHARAAAVGRRPEADVRRRRGDRSPLPLQRLQPRPRARTARSGRRSPTDRSPPIAGRATSSSQRELAALELRRDAQARKEQRRQYKIRERAMRRNQH